MRVFLANAYPGKPRSYLPLVQGLASADRFQLHELVENSEEADLIWFVDARSDFNDWYLTRLRHHPLVRRLPNKCMMYNEVFDGWPGLPGLFVSPPASRFDPTRQRACGYIVGSLNPAMAGPGRETTEQDLLYSFMGRPVCPLRERMMRIQHERGLMEDTTGFNYFTGSVDERLKQQQEAYASVIFRSQFVLCPRGIATSSYRMYEAMAAGRCPVVISDEWVRPSGPDWESFAVFVPESDVERIPELLESLESEAAERGRLARQAYQEWFADDVRFHRMMDWCQEILESRRLSERIVQWIPNRQVMGRRWGDAKKSARGVAKRILKPAVVLS